MTSSGRSRSRWVTPLLVPALVSMVLLDGITLTCSICARVEKFVPMQSERLLSQSTGLWLKCLGCGMRLRLTVVELEHALGVPW